MAFLILIGSMQGLIVPNWPAMPSQHLVTGISVLQASADPFSDPVFMTNAQSTVMHFTPIMTGEPANVWD
jgi:hypothetical protein